MARKKKQSGSHKDSRDSITADNELSEATSSVDNLVPSTPEEEVALQSIFDVLRKSARIDFSHYRRTTVLRRLTRRMALCNQNSYAAYLGFLESNANEMTLLHDDLLLSYTEFFRDPDVFKMLKEKVFPRLAENRSAKMPIRIWVPGCSTGEEVYSLAICLHEFLEKTKSGATVQFFGTDPVRGHIAKARAALYPEKIRKEVSKVRRERFFDRTPDGLKVVKHIREKCVFAVQDVTQDPPFSQIDLVSFRNVLIYFDSAFQERAIPLFHYALNPEGFLLLGSSETMGKFSDLFSPVDQKANLYTKRASGTKPVYRFPAVPTFLQLKTAKEHSSAPASGTYDAEIGKRIDGILLDSYAPAGVLVDGSLQILQFRGHTAPYLEPESGEASLRLSRMVPEGLMPDLHVAIAEAKKKQEKVRKKNITFTLAGKVNTIDICIIPVPDAETGETCFLILFEELRAPQAPVSARPVRSDHGDDELQDLKHEIQSTKEHMQAIIEEKDEVNQELRAANEEVQSTNEELQSVNEELGAAKEELESSNEELLSLNEDLHAKNIEVRESAERFETSIENMLDCFGIYSTSRDESGRIVDFRIEYVNKAACGSNRLTKDEQIGKRLCEVLPAHRETGLFDEYCQVVETGKSLVKEMLVYEDAYAEQRLSRAFDIHVAKLGDGFVASWRDVTKRKRAEWELRESEKRFKDLYENAPNAYFSVGMDGCIHSCNRRAEELLGYAVGELVGRSVFETYANTPQGKDRALRLFEHFRGGKAIINEELQMQKADGTPVWISLTVNAVRNAEGRIVESRSIALDISERKRLEEHEEELQERLARAKRLESLEVLASGVAHDLNNILGPMVVLPGLIAEDIQALIPESNEATEELFESLEVIMSSAKQAAAIVTDLVHLSRQGQYSTHVMNLHDLPCLAHDCGKFDSIRKEHPGISIKIELAKESMTISGDESHLTRVVSNLLQNAAESIKGKGNIIIRTEKRSLNNALEGYETIPRGDYAVVEVSDTGQGIEKEHMGRIFEPFFTKKERGDHSGTGLGLSVVHGIVKDHGAFINVVSEVGKGTTFALYLPLIDESSDVTQASEQKLGSRGSERVLIVDDEPVQRFLVKKGLKRLGYDISEADNGHQAVALFEKAKKAEDDTPFDLIVLDMIMEEDFDGLDTYEAILKLYPDQKAIIASGYAENARVKAAEKLGADWLAKPYEMNDLAGATRKKLDEKAR